MNIMAPQTASRRALLIGGAAFAFVAPGIAWAKVVAPKLGPLKSVPEAPYNEAANANAAVKAAEARAKKSGKLLLIDMGGNWCPDCRLLSGIIERPEAKAFMRKHYEVVMVDVGRMDKNLQIPARYGIGKIEGVPAVIVVDPKGKVLNKGDHFALSDARGIGNQAVMDKLAEWVG
jgi:thiol-disulfide isomerase/thioredoxin